MLNIDLMIILAAAGESAIKTEAVTSDQLLILWCVIGGFCGSFCSLRFFQPKSYIEATSQFFVNLSLSAIASPLLVDQISKWTGFPIGLRLALPVAMAVGIVGCQTVGRIIPYFEQWIGKKGQQIVDRD